MSENLLPCPFCGSSNVDVGASQEMNDSGEYTEEGRQWTVLCPGCGASSSLYDESEADAIRSWNTRAPAPTPLMPVRKEMVELQIKAIDRCMNLVNNMRMSEAGIIDDPRFAGQRGKDRSDALYDVFHMLWAVAKEYSKSEEVPSPADACTCHPDDNPPVPCAQKYAYSECVAASPSTAISAPQSDQLQSLAAKISAKIEQLTHYRDNDCQFDHARTIAEGRISQATQIQHWIAEEMAATRVFSSDATPQSPPPGSAPHNSGERLPNSDVATSGGDTRTDAMTAWVSMPPEPTQEMVDRMTASIDCPDIPTADDLPDRDYDYDMRKAYRALRDLLLPRQNGQTPGAEHPGNDRSAQ